MREQERRNLQGRVRLHFVLHMREAEQPQPRAQVHMPAGLIFQHAGLHMRLAKAGDAVH